MSRHLALRLCTRRRTAATKTGSDAAPFELAYRSGKNYILQCNTAIGVAGLLPFLGVSSLNFGPLARVAFFLRWVVVANATGEPQVDLLLTTVSALADEPTRINSSTFLVSV